MWGGGFFSQWSTYTSTAPPSDCHCSELQSFGHISLLRQGWIHLLGFLSIITGTDPVYSTARKPSRKHADQTTKTWRSSPPILWLVQLRSARHRRHHFLCTFTMPSWRCRSLISSQSSFETWFPALIGRDCEWQQMRYFPSKDARKRCQLTCWL